MNAAKKREIRGMYIMGENPAMSDPDVDHAREAIAALDHLVVQDIFLTETAYLADVVLPATAWPEKIGTVTNTDRMVQLGRKAIDPPGDAREDLVDHQRGGTRASGSTGAMRTRGEVFEEMRTCMDSIAGHHLGATRARVVGHLSVPQGRRPRPAGRLRHQLPDGDGPRPSSCRPISSPRPSGPDAQYPIGAHHRTAARTLAHRRDDAARGRPRSHRAGAGRFGASAGSRGARRRSQATL